MIDYKDIKVGLEFRLYRADKETLQAQRACGKIPVVRDYSDYEIKDVEQDCCRCKLIGSSDDIEYTVALDKILELGEKFPEVSINAKEDEYERIEKESEQVSHPSHYSWLKDLCGVEPIDICRHFDFAVGNALKYLMRKDKVDGDKTKTEKRVEDLRKAIFYIEDEIKLLSDGKE